MTLYVAASADSGKIRQAENTGYTQRISQEYSEGVGRAHINTAVCQGQ